MPYPALPDRRIPYDNDGTLCYRGDAIQGALVASTGVELINLQDATDATLGGPNTKDGTTNYLFHFYPEQREITGLYGWGTGNMASKAWTVQGSNDTTNGLDGTWETASMPGGSTFAHATMFDWRSGIKPVSFTGPKKNVRYGVPLASFEGGNWAMLHVYGEAAAGAMAHDLVFIDQDNGGGPIPFPTPEDFGDQPLGTTVVRQFRVKNTSATKTATNVNIQCNDADFAISEDSVNWVVTINIASLGPGVESATYYVRCTTPAPGAALGPRTPARIIATCDAGFFG